MPLSADDHAEIQQLYARYNHAIDAGDVDAYLACFAADAYLDAGVSQSKGTEELAAFCTSVPTMVPGIRHFLGNLLVRGDGDRATGEAYLVLYSAASGQPALFSSGRYHDELQRLDGSWRFVDRRFSIDGA